VIKTFIIGLPGTEVGVVHLYPSARYADREWAWVQMGICPFPEDDWDTLVGFPRHYRLLDKGYPAARFVLPVRDKMGWLLECQQRYRDFAGEGEVMLVDAFGTTEFHWQHFSDVYDAHTEMVMRWFRTLPDHRWEVKKAPSGDGAKVGELQGECRTDD
jgi:hypothetical protein